MSVIWFPTGVWCVNLLQVVDGPDGSGVLDASLHVPPYAKELILTVERGYSPLQTGANAVSLRVMPYGYDLSNPLDRAKTQQWMTPTAPAADIIAEDVRMPIYNGDRRFFWAMQSSDPNAYNKIAFIDLWGYVT